MFSSESLVCRPPERLARSWRPQYYLSFCLVLSSVITFSNSVFSSDIFISQHTINPSVYDTFDGNLVGSLPRTFMRVGNTFDLSFDIKLNEPFWEAGEEMQKILTLASNRVDFIDGGTETLELSINNTGLIVTTHYRSYTRIFESDQWVGLSQDLSQWHTIRITSDGFGGLGVYVNGQHRFTLIDSSDPGWLANPSYQAAWNYRSSGVAHNIWAPVPGAKGADVTLNNLIISGGQPALYSYSPKRKPAFN